MPRVAELGLASGVRRPGCGDFTPRAEGAEGEKRAGCDKGISRRRQIELRGAQQNHACFAVQLFHERFRRVRGGDFLKQRAHGYEPQDKWMAG